MKLHALLYRIELLSTNNLNQQLATSTLFYHFCLLLSAKLSRRMSGLDPLSYAWWGGQMVKMSLRPHCPNTMSCWSQRQQTQMKTFISVSGFGLLWKLHQHRKVLNLARHAHAYDIHSYCCLIKNRGNSPMTYAASVYI